jgi:acyl-CoA dehydrogenase
MAIDFTLSNEQRELQANTREFAENVLGPVVREADAEPDPLRAFQLTKPAYVAAYKAGIAFCMLPREYGGGGLSNVDLIVAGEELCAVDPGFACTVLVNGLGLLPVWYYGTEEQKERFLRRATSDPTGEYLVGYAASEPAGSPGGTAGFDTPLPHPVGIGVTAGATATSTSSTGGSTGRATSPAGTGTARTRASSWSAPIRTRAAPRGCRRSWSIAARRACRTS